MEMKIAGPQKSVQRIRPDVLIRAVPKAVSAVQEKWMQDSCVIQTSLHIKKDKNKEVKLILVM